MVSSFALRRFQSIDARLHVLAPCFGHIINCDLPRVELFNISRLFADFREQGIIRRLRDLHAAGARANGD